MHVSVRASALARTGYASLAEGLTDLALRRVEVDVTPACEAPRLDGDGASLLPIAGDGSARAYRQHIYDHAVSLSALRFVSPSAEGVTAASAGEIRQVIRAAETIGAPVLCLDPEVDAAEGPGGLAGWLPILPEETSGTRAALTVVVPADARAVAELASWLEGAPARPGLAVEVGASVTGAAPAGYPYDSLRLLAPYVRHVVCRAEPREQGESAEPCPLADGSVDFARIAAILGGAGYAGALTISLPEGGDGGAARQVLRADAAYLKDIIGEY